jgi:Domain of unknown function (DUF4091)
MPVIDTTCADYPSNIWVTGPLVKVYQNTGTAGTCPGPTGNKWITIYGTQNEFVDFQVHFHDAGSGTTGFNVTVSSFVQTSPSSFTIAAPDSTQTDIIAWREAYQNVTTLSAAINSSTSSFKNNILGVAGFIPDILIPAIDPYYHQTTNAFPFNIAAGNNQSVWIDVHIPTNAPAGYYEGTVSLQSGCPSNCVTITTIPIIIGVWQWPRAGYMPSTATLPSYETASWSSLCNAAYPNGYAGCGAFTGAGGSADAGAGLQVRDFAMMMLDHRLSGPNPIYPPPVSGNFTTVDKYFGGIEGGTANTILPGAKTTGVDFQSGSTTRQQWMTHWTGNGWFTPFNYTCDEPPSTCAWSDVSKIATTYLHNATPMMPSLVTTDIAHADANSVAACGTSTCLQNSIDWFMPQVTNFDQFGGSNHRADYNTWLTGNCCGAGSPPRRLGWYQACDSIGCGNSGATETANRNYFNLQIDGTPIANRAMEWLSFKNQMSFELYYDTVYCWGACGSNGGDPWNGVFAFGLNGDGTLVYPSRALGTTDHVTTSAGTTLTTPIYLPSIRLQHIRDGMQDYEYLNVLTNNGEGSVATSAIQSWISNSYTFNNTLAPVGGYTSDLPDARIMLGTTMHQLTYSQAPAPPPAPPTNLTITVP